MKTKEAYQQGLRTYLILKNYSPATVSAYGCAFRQFLDWRTTRKYGYDFTPDQARQYLLYRCEGITKPTALRVICSMENTRAAVGLTALDNTLFNVLAWAGIGRSVSAHVLRHCYATHHLEKGEVLPDGNYASIWLGSRSPPLRPIAVEPDFEEVEGIRV